MTIVRNAVAGIEECDQCTLVPEGCECAEVSDERDATLLMVLRKEFGKDADAAYAFLVTKGEAGP